MILYKYLPPERLDVLRRRRIRFTQPGDFNDPFEFRPRIEPAPAEHSRDYVEANFDRLLEEEVAKYGAAFDDIMPRALLKDSLRTLRGRAPELYRLLEPGSLPQASLSIDGLLNTAVGVLCLSEVRDSILMWGHYADSHRGFVIGFDSESSFFHTRRSEHDEFGFLRSVEYRRERPSVVLSDTSSPAWFQTKPDQWTYEKEWRMVTVLSGASERIDRLPFPVCLFEFPCDAVVEVVLGLRHDETLLREVRSLLPMFPRAALLAVREDPASYSLLLERVEKS